MAQRSGGSKPGEKLLFLFTILLFCKEKQSLATLAEKLDCSKQTVLRILPVLEKFGAGRILEEKRGRASFYWLEKPQNIVLHLSQDGLRHLALCMNFFSNIAPESIRTEMMSTLLAATGQVLDDAFNLEKYNSIGKNVSKGRIDYNKFKKQYDALLSAIAEKHVCTLTYTTWGTRKTRSMAPVNLLILNGCIYLRAWVVPQEGEAVPKYKKSLSLALHNICEVTVDGRTYGKLPVISENDFGIIQGEQFRAKVKFNDHVKDYVIARIWSDDQHMEESDGGVILNFTVANKHELISWVLSFGPNAELMEPIEIREEIRRSLTDVMARYKKS